mgnify:CR=1 FL=1
MIYNRFPCYGAMICFEGRKNYREKKETKVKSRCGTFESSIGFIDLTEVLKNLLLMVHQCFDIWGCVDFFRYRTDHMPIVIGGGPCAYNPEPIADFFDIEERA